MEFSLSVKFVIKILEFNPILSIGITTQTVMNLSTVYLLEEKPFLRN